MCYRLYDETDFLAQPEYTDPEIRRTNLAAVVLQMRAFGLGDIPLICARELDVEGGTPLCVRVMLHLETDKSRDELHHVYQHGARNLRDDLPR